MLAERERLGELRGVAHEQPAEAGQVHPARAALERRHGGRSEQIMGLVALEQRVRHENLVRPPHAGHRVGPALRREPLEERVAQLQHQPALLGSAEAECTPVPVLHPPTTVCCLPEPGAPTHSNAALTPSSSASTSGAPAASKTAAGVEFSPSTTSAACAVRVPSNSCVCKTPPETSTRASADGGHGRRRTTVRSASAT